VSVSGLGEVGLAAAPLLLAVLPGPFALAPPGLLAANVRGLLLSLVVVYVLAAGLLLYNVLQRAGAIRALAGAVAGATADPARRALLVAGGLSPFFESVSGFGLAVVIVGPLLLALGFDAKRATLLALLGQNAVPWGAMAIGTLIGAELTDLSARDMGVGSAWLNAPLALLYNGLTVAVAAGPAMVGKRLPDIVLGAAALAGGVLAGSAYVSVELAGVLTSRLVPTARAWLEDTLVLDAAAYGVRLPLLYSPAFFLLVASAAAVLLFGLTRRAVFEALAATARQWWPAAAATSAFVTLSTAMVAAGMTTRLAEAAAAATGAAFVLLSPLVGGLGGFMTGSNTAGNAMFGRFQVETARRAGLPPDVLAYANNVAAANATMASPSRVVLATAVTGRRGEEGQAVRAILPIVGAALTIIALHVALWSAWS
jgi:lactate permease